MDALKDNLAADGVSRAIQNVRLLASRPSPLVDPVALVAALQQLADIARDTGHADREKFNAVFKQCRPLISNVHLPAIVTRLLGEEQERLVANQINKFMRSSSLAAPSMDFGAPNYPFNYGPSFPYRGRGRGARPPPYSRIRCYNCRQLGHFAAQCRRR